MIDLENLKKIMKKRKVSPFEIMQNTALNPNTVSRIMNSIQKDCNTTTIKEFSSYLKCKIEDLVK